MTDLPREVVTAAERLTQLARRAIDDAEAAAYERDREERLAEHGFTARVRESDDTLVLHPAEWLDGDTARMDRIEDTDRAVEVSLSGGGDPDAWDEVETHNAAVVERVAERAGGVHATNARAFADFMGNHYARRMETATAAELAEFLTEYYPRNAWPSDEQRDAVEQSLEHVFTVTETPMPELSPARRRDSGPTRPGRRR
ncbi:MAG: rnhA operon protein [Haloplanus sp.]